MRITIYFLLLVVAIYAISNTTFAQTVQQELLVRIIPEIPRPNQNVTITIESFRADINTSTITWVVNDRVYREGIGINSINLPSGNSGSKTKVDITVRSPEGALIKKSVEIIPAEVDILWNAHSYIPPFYKGKALYPFQGDVTVTAIPHLASGGVSLASNNLVYVWKKDGTPIDSGSGYGKNSILIKGSVLPRPITVEVEVYNLQNTMRAKAETIIAPVQPIITFYENNPLFGILYNRALSSEYVFDKQETRIHASPYYLGTSESDRNIVFTWRINGSTIPSVSSNEIAIGNTGNSSGISNISLLVENVSKIMQRASGKLNITLKPKSDFSF
jgi:hypothetical protein